MLREKTIVLSIVFSLISLVVAPFHAYGQTAKSLLKIERTALTPNPSANLFLNSETGESKIKANLDRIEKEQYKSGYNRKRALSSKAKTGIYVGIGAAVAAIIIVVLVSRKDDNNDDNRLFCAIPEGCTN